MKKVELLAPAGDLEKLEVALVYGADAVFIGGQHFSLRSRASNFSIEDIKKGCAFAHSLGKKVYVTCNIVMHEDDLSNIDKYLKQLEEAGVDAIITSSLYMSKFALENTTLKVHISTQDSILNTEGVQFYKQLGAERVVLGRECSISDIKAICDQNITQIEVFIHGGMCSSYSGKCMLSNVLTNRDANRGGCAHTCRWKYDIYEKNKNISNEEYFSMSSKDLCSINDIPALIESGADSFKIEGRMKSVNYIACIVKAYRQCIDDYCANKELDFNKYYEIIRHGENRETSYGFLHGQITVNQQLFDLDKDLRKAGEFVGIVQSYDTTTHIVSLKLKNKIEKNGEYILFSKDKDDIEFLVNEFSVHGDTKKVNYSVADDIVTFASNIPMYKYDIVRTKKIV